MYFVVLYQYLKTVLRCTVQCIVQYLKRNCAYQYLNQSACLHGESRSDFVQNNSSTRTSMLLVLSNVHKITL